MSLYPRSVSKLPDRLRDLIEDELAGDETIVWLDQPIPMRFAMKTLPIFLFGIPWTASVLLGLALFVGSGFLNSEVGLLFLCFHVLFLLIGLGMLGSPLWMLLKAKRTAYVITDYRAIIFDRRLLNTTIRSFSPEQLRRGFERKQRGDGSGDLVFDRKIEYDEGGRRWIDIGFLAIPNVKAVESILRDVLVDDETTVAESDFEETEPVWGEAEEWRFPEETQETGRQRMGCTQILAGMMAVGFVITAIFALFTVNFIHTITDRAAIKQMLDAETLVVEVVPALLAEGEGEPAGVAEMVKADPLVLQTAVRELLPPGWVKAQADATVDAVFDFLETGDPTDAEVAVDVRPVLIRLRSDPGYQAVLAWLQVLPACPEPDPTFDVEGDAFEIKDCLPPNAPVAEVARRIHQDVVVAIDESAVLKGEGGVVRVPLLDEETLTPARREQLERVRWFYWLGRQRAGLLWLIPVGCLSLIVLLAVRSLKRLGYWWGWPLAITGGIGLILALLMPALASSALSSGADATPLAASLSRLARHFLDALTRLWLRQVAFQAAAMLGFGIALIALGYTRGTNGGNVL